MFRFFKYICFFSALSFSSAYACLNVAAECALCGQVCDSDGKPLQGAQVFTSTGQADVTDSMGRFCFQNLRSESITLYIEHIGYGSETISSLSVIRDSSLHVPPVYLEPAVIEFNQIVVSAARRSRPRENIAKSVDIVAGKELQQRQGKTSAEILRQEKGVFVQKTGHGGGSAIIRGLSSNQILLLVDGIRLNNSTYRLGNHSYLTTVDNLALQRIEVVHGPASVLYGSDALGGSVNCITKTPPFSDKGMTWKPQLYYRYASADGENTFRLEQRMAGEQIAMLTGISRKRFGDLRRGANSPHPELENSTHGLVQSPSGYVAWDADVKLRYALSADRIATAAYQYTTQNRVPRYDKYENQNYYHWIYHPHRRQLAYVKYHSRSAAPWLQSWQIGVSYHLQEEGREIQKTASSLMTQEKDAVHTLGVQLQVNAMLYGHLITTGADAYFDTVFSERFQIRDQKSEKAIQGRYPNGAAYNSIGWYLRDEYHFSQQWIAIAGMRYSYYQTRFNLPALQTLFPAPLRQSFHSVCGNLGLVWKVMPAMTIKGQVAQAYRAPNLSDVAKLGESKGSVYEIPNPTLKPERLENVELGIQLQSKSMSLQLTGFFARIKQLIASADARFKGESFIRLGNREYKIKSKQNIGRANLYGAEACLHYQPNRYFMVWGSVANIVGENLTLDEPVGGVPPLFGFFGMKTLYSKWKIEAFTRFAFAQKRLSPDDLDDPRIPNRGTPGWQTLNVRCQYNLTTRITIGLALENIFDLNYREHGSGINAPGRNFIASLAFN